MHNKLSSITLTNNAPGKYGVLIVISGIHATYYTVYYTIGVRIPCEQSKVDIAMPRFPRFRLGLMSQCAIRNVPTYYYLIKAEFRP